MLATVATIDNENITLDLNHELAGKHLNFDVEMVKHCPAERMQKVAFGAGCFWGPELAFMRSPGRWRWVGGGAGCCAVSLLWGWVVLGWWCCFRVDGLRGGGEG
jgi:hypothetical protein